MKRSVRALAEECVRRFLALDDRTVAALLARHPSRVAFGTAPRSGSWRQVRREGAEYTLEFFRFSGAGHWRILRGERRLRVAWGRRVEELDNLLGDRPVNWFANLREPGGAFSFFPHPPEPERRKVVFLLHGILVRAAAMERLARALAAGGYQVCSYDYDFTHPGGNAKFAADFLRRFRAETAAADGREFYCLTHSNGGIVLRLAMARMRREELARLRAVVMLAPPNRGSAWATLASYFSSLRVFGELSHLPKSSVNRIVDAAPLPPVGIIRGCGDCKVSRRRAHLPHRAEAAFLSIPGNHFLIRDPRCSLRPVLEFFERGRFG